MVSVVDYSLDIVGLSKSFRRQTLSRSGYTTLKSALLGGLAARFKRLWSTESRPEDARVLTRAIDDLTIRIPRGSSVGIIGRNGSGKSTLLKLITGIYKADRGTVRVNGRIAALIELGAGFHPDFSGRENLLLGGVMHGLTRKQLEKLLPEIVEFAELTEVIDDPVRTYSSGMFMRLGFSLAVHTNPDILIIDEVLAVGDAAFTSKCKERIARLRREGKTLLLVSHDLEAVERWCDEVVWLNRGKVADRGNPRRVIDHYREHIERGEEDELRSTIQLSQGTLTSTDSSSAIAASPSLSTTTPDLEAQQHADSQTKGQRWGSREIEILNVSLQRANGEEHLLFHPHEALEIVVEYCVRDKEHVKPDTVVFGIGITRSDGVLVHGTNTEIDGAALRISTRGGAVRYRMKRLGLLEGNYRLDVAVHRNDGYPYDYHEGVLTFAVRSSTKQVGVFLPESSWHAQDNSLADSTPRVAGEAWPGRI